MLRVRAAGFGPLRHFAATQQSVALGGNSRHRAGSPRLISPLGIAQQSLAHVWDLYPLQPEGIRHYKLVTTARRLIL